MQFIATMGNEKSNNIFECKLTKSKPNANSHRQEKEQFIREKYEMKLFTDTVKTRELPIPPKKQMNYHKEGFLTKLEPNSRKAKKLWCTLKALQSQAPSFYYYHVRGDPAPAGIIDVSTAAVRPIVYSYRPFSFEIITPARIFTFCAATETDKQDWMEKLREVIETDENEIKI